MAEKSYSYDDSGDQRNLFFTSNVLLDLIQIDPFKPKVVFPKF